MRRREFITLLSGVAVRSRFAASRNVCFWHKADIAAAHTNVRYWGQYLLLT